MVVEARAVAATLVAEDPDLARHPHLAEEVFLREHLFDFELDAYRPLGDPTRFLAALASLFSRCKDEDIDPADYLAYAGRLGESAVALAAAVAGQGDAATDADRTAADVAMELARRQLELAGAYRRYQQLLHASGFIDFGDQVSLALRLLRQSPAARQEIQDRYRYILVDEFQDTNRAQAELVSLLAERHHNITVVGDDDQSIYTFRGAAVSNILDFADRHPRVRTVVLRRNYRSLAPILAASHRLIRFNDPDRLEVKAGRQQGAAPGTPAAAQARRPSAWRPSRPGRRRRTGSPAEIGRRIADGRAARPRGPGPDQRGGGRGPAQPQPGRHSVAVHRHVRPLLAAGGAAAAVAAAGRRGPVVQRGRLRASRPRRSTGWAARTSRRSSMRPGAAIGRSGRSSRSWSASRA